MFKISDFFEGFLVDSFSYAYFQILAKKFDKKKIGNDFSDK